MHMKFIAMGRGNENSFGLRQTPLERHVDADEYKPHRRTVPGGIKKDDRAFKLIAQMQSRSHSKAFTVLVFPCATRYCFSLNLPAGGKPAIRTEVMTNDKPVEITYFGLQAYTGTTKHMGGLESTKELIDLCRIGAGMHVLDVGCGVGATASYLIRTHGCTVVGVDVTPGMIDRANERARAEGIQDRVEFKVGDAQKLPVKSDLFDAVICESVLTFISDKQAAIAEFARAAKPGGYVGLNEETWLKTPVPQEMIEYTHSTWDIRHEVPTRGDWEGMMESSGLREVSANIHRFDTARESSQVKRYRVRDMWLMMTRSLSLMISSPEFRRYMKQRRGLPKNLFDYLGYGLFIGRKSE